MSPEIAAALLELCAIIEAWPSHPAQADMKELKRKLEFAIDIGDISMTAKEADA